ncbi:hypothetical protein DESC_830044 [Desulfosarcina cetonica]|nr:hypothetical protein DESC_830044 [Desulfosarcina cetonica]
MMAGNFHAFLGLGNRDEAFMGTPNQKSGSGLKGIDFALQWALDAGKRDDGRHAMLRYWVVSSGNVPCLKARFDGLYRVD